MKLSNGRSWRSDKVVTKMHQCILTWRQTGCWALGVPFGHCPNNTFSQKNSYLERISQIVELGAKNEAKMGDSLVNGHINGHVSDSLGNDLVIGCVTTESCFVQISALKDWDRGKQYQPLFGLAVVANSYRNTLD